MPSWASGPGCATGILGGHWPASPQRKVLPLPSTFPPNGTESCRLSTELSFLPAARSGSQTDLDVRVPPVSPNPRNDFTPSHMAFLPISSLGYYFLKLVTMCLVLVHVLGLFPVSLVWLFLLSRHLSVPLSQFCHLASPGWPLSVCVCLPIPLSAPPHPSPLRERRQRHNCDPYPFFLFSLSTVGFSVSFKKTNQTSKTIFVAF